MALGQGLEDSGLSLAIKGADWAIPLLQSIHIVTIGVVFVSSLMIALRVMGSMRADEPFAVVWGRFAPWMWYGLVVMVVTGVLLVIGEPVREFTALSFWLKMTLLALAVISTFVFGRTFGAAAAARTGAGTAASSSAAYAGASSPGGDAAYAGLSGAGAARSSPGGSSATYAGMSGAAHSAPGGGGATYAGVSGAGAAQSSPAGGAAYASAAGAEFSFGAKLMAAGIMVLWLAIIFLGRAIAYDVEVWGSLSLHPGG